jgi:predicted Zn finger-like uncharacterized protein
MRLTCPNCDAQYEVPAEVMPPEGRDVQCSNCGQTWFQAHPDHPQDPPEDWQAPLEDEEVVSTAPQREPDPVPEPEHEHAPVPDHEPDPEESDPALHEAPVPHEPEVPAEPAPVARRELDPSVAEVLRAEAELEAQARRNEAAVMESQPELGLPDTSDDAARRAREAQERMAKMRGIYDDDPSDDSAATAVSSTSLGARRDLLPDIEEINSTLRSNSSRSPAADPGQTAQIEVREKRSSRLGFSLTVALVAILTLIYVFAPSLSDAVPGAAPLLEDYVAVVDDWRAWLDRQLTTMLTWLDNTTGSGAE